MKCRDYLLDGLVWSRRPELYRSKIYGYPFIENVNTVAVELVMKGERGQLLNNIGTLRRMERLLGLPATILRRIDKKTWYIRASTWWNTTTIHLSTYTLILRVLEYVKDCTDWETLEHSLPDSMNKLEGKLRRVLFALRNSGYDTLFPVKDTEKHTLHNCSGVLTFVVYEECDLVEGYNFGDFLDAYRNDKHGTKSSSNAME